MSVLTATELETPIRVNLLPGELAQARKLRNVKLGALAAVLVVGLGVAGLTWQADQGVSDAQASLDQATAQVQKLQAEAAKFAKVPLVYAAVETSVNQLKAARATEVHWSDYLTDLAVQVPKTVWLTGMQVTGQQPGAVTPITSGDPLAPAETVGTVTYTGYAASKDDVAKWLDSLVKVKTGVYPYTTSITDAKIGTRNVVQFSSSLLIKPNALVALQPGAASTGAGQ